MESKNLLTINQSKKYIDEVKSYCQLNDINIDDFVLKCFDEGYRIQKYGLLSGQEQTTKEVIVEKTIEVIKEVPIEIIKEVEKIVYITDDTKEEELLFEIQQLKDEKNELLQKMKNLENTPLEVIEKEVIVEKPVELIKEIEVIKEVEVIKEIENKDRIKELQETIKVLRTDLINKDEKILQLEKDFLELKKVKGDIKVQFMGSSNLNDNLYK